MILVTGMHRSGTSLVCQLLARLGVSFGDPADRFPADRWNEAGYFEQRAVMDLNSRIVTGWPRNRSRLAAWLAKLRYLRMPSDAAIAARAARHRAALQELAARHAGCALKDPRFCLTLRFWLAAADVAHVVVCRRHPAAVVASLARRDRLPRGLAARFYAWHVERLLAQLPQERAVFVDVDRLAAGDAAELDALRAALALAPAPPSATLLAEVVQTRHWHEAAAPAPCPPAALAAWERLCQGAAAGGCT